MLLSLAIDQLGFQRRTRMTSFLVPLEYLGCFCQRSGWVLAGFFHFVKGLAVTTSYSPYQLHIFKSNYMWDLWYSVTMKTYVVWFIGSWWGSVSRSGRLDIDVTCMLTSWEARLVRGAQPQNGLCFRLSMVTIQFITLEREEAGTDYWRWHWLGTQPSGGKIFGLVVEHGSDILVRPR